MIRLEYAGPKPIISARGIEFITGKPDKYIYIPSAVKLFLLLSDQSNWHGNQLSYDFPNDMLSDAEMLDAITGQDEAIIAQVEARMEAYNMKLEKECDEVGTLIQFSEFEQRSYLGNLKAIMAYRKQRACNKMLYHVLISRIVQEIIDKEIDSLDAPPFRSFLHILDSIKGELIGKRVSSNIHVSLISKGSSAVLRLSIKAPL